MLILLQVVLVKELGIINTKSLNTIKLKRLDWQSSSSENRHRTLITIYRRSRILKLKLQSKEIQNKYHLLIIYYLYLNFKNLYNDIIIILYNYKCDYIQYISILQKIANIFQTRLTIKIIIFHNKCRKENVCFRNWLAVCVCVCVVKWGVVKGKMMCATLIDSFNFIN